MPTDMGTKPAPQPKPEPVSPPANEPELFAAEIAMEKRSYNFAPILLAIALLGLLGGFGYYFYKSMRDVPSTAEATAVVNDILRSQGGAVTRFSTGAVEPDNGQKDPGYKLLTKTGVVTSVPKGTNQLFVTMTDPGETVLAGIDGVEKVKRSTGTGFNFSVPLATRQLVSIDKITLVKPHLATVQYTWKWDPNRLGRQFDAASELVKSFSTWERSTLIKSWGVDFYGAAPTKASISLRSDDSGWKPYTE